MCRDTNGGETEKRSKREERSLGDIVNPISGERDEEDGALNHHSTAESRVYTSRGQVYTGKGQMQYRKQRKKRDDDSEGEKKRETDKKFQTHISLEEHNEEQNKKDADDEVICEMKTKLGYGIMKIIIISMHV